MPKTNATPPPKKLETKNLIDNIFKIDKRILQVGISEFAQPDKFLAFETRSGCGGLPNKAELESAGMVFPPIVMHGTTERIQSFLGKVGRLSVRFEKLLLSFYRIDGYLIGVGLEPQTESALLDKIGNLLDGFMKTSS